jgi:hypothetical protein
MRREESCIRAALCALVLGAVGCTDEPLVEPTGSTGQWLPLVEADWQLAAGEEGYTCARATVTEDVYIDAFRALSPLGTHHTVLSVDRSSSSTAPDGTFECDAATNGQNMLFGSGVGTLPVEFPEGVAIKIEKGSSLILNLHLFNVSTDALSDRSGIEVRRVAAQDVVHEAEIVLAGKVSGLVVPPGESTQTGECAMSHDVTLFAVFPHMHQLGSHLKATAAPAGGSPSVLVDAPYSFDDQVYYDVDPQLSLKSGDLVSVECSYENPGAETITFGDSSLEEMCFVGLYRYPRGEGGLVCASGTGTPTIPGPPCAEPGATGNEKGVGKICSDGGGECGGGAPLCLADYADGDFANYCTLICQSDADCGSGAVCLGPSTKACVPAECAAALGG